MHAARPHCAVCKHWKRVASDYSGGECTCSDLDLAALPEDLRDQMLPLPSCGDDEEDMLFTNELFCCDRWFEPLAADETVIDDG